MSTGQGPTDRGEVKQIIERQRKEKRDKLYVRVDVENNRVIIGGVIALKLKMGDSVIILEDEFKSSYDCKTCDGTGEVIKTCLKCEGTGNLDTPMSDNYLEPTMPCGKCEGKGTWLTECSDCKGKGALLEIPDQAKARPTSGKIVAAGPNVVFAQVGDRVAYSGYTGHLLPFKGNTRLRIMGEKEFFCYVEDVAGGTQEGEKIEFIDKDTAYDLS